MLPDGYTGPVYLIEDERNGARIPYVDGRYVAEMPANCQLRVKSLSPLLRWHNETIRYKNGKVIRDKISMPSRDPSAVMLRSSNCGSANGGPTRIEMFIGTEEQYTQFLNGPSPDFR